MALVSHDQHSQEREGSRSPISFETIINENLHNKNSKVERKSKMMMMKKQKMVMDVVIRTSS